MTTYFDETFDRLFRQAARPFAGFDGLFDAVESASVRGPVFYGYTLTVGPDGRPVLREYGNGSPGQAGQDDARDPLVETILDEKQGVVKLVAEIPGVERSDIKVRVENGTAHIDAEHGDKRFSTKVPIKHRVDAESGKASYRNGILELTFPLLEEKPKGKIIEVG